MTLRFTHTTLGQRVLFGAGQAAEHVAAEVERLGARRPMLIAAPFEAEIGRRVTADVELAHTHDEVAMHVPVETAQRGREAAAAHEADVLISVGGGSTTGLAKAIALTTRLPIIAVPTTYAGSEATNVWGMTEDARKTTGVDDVVLPASVVYDSELTLTLPVEMSVASGLNGMAHCIDSLWAPRVDPINSALAVEGIRALSGALRGIVADPGDVDGRDAALYGAYLSAVAFASAGSGMHHKICHVLGGTFDLPHAQTHAVVLPHVLAYNAPAAPEAADRIAAALGADDAVEGLLALGEEVGAPTSLAEIGFTASGIPETVELASAAIPADNPRQVTPDGLAGLLADALNGDRPGTSTRAVGAQAAPTDGAAGADVGAGR